MYSICVNWYMYMYLADIDQLQVGGVIMTSRRAKNGYCNGSCGVSVLDLFGCAGVTTKPAAVYMYVSAWCFPYPKKKHTAPAVCMYQTVSKATTAECKH